MARKRWQDWTNAVVGLWLFASPSILGFGASENPATQVAWLLGLAILVFAGIAVYMPKAWEEAINIVLGICVFASPWLWGYANQATPATNAVAVGLLVTVLAVWAMLRDTAVQRWWRARRVTH